MSKKIILLAGPTASGKSRLAIQLAKKIKGQIINADSMQIYKEFSILSSRPCKQELKKAKHHLYGIVSVKKYFSAGDWLKRTKAKINNCLKNKKVPLEERVAAQLKLAKLPRNSAKIRIRNRCEITGRPHGVYRKLKISRIALRELALSGKIPGMTKSSW